MLQTKTDGPRWRERLRLWACDGVSAVLVLTIEQIDRIGKNIRRRVDLEAQARVVNHIGALNRVEGAALIKGKCSDVAHLTIDPNTAIRIPSARQ